MADNECTIIIASDTHGDFDKLEGIVNTAIAENVDAISLNGDILDVDEEFNQRFLGEIQADLTEEEKKRSRSFEIDLLQHGLTIEQLELIIKFGNIPQQERERVTELIELYKKIKQTQAPRLATAIANLIDYARAQYKKVDDLFAKFKGKLLYVPGNHDPAPALKELKRFYPLHEKPPVTVNGVVITGTNYSSGEILLTENNVLRKLFPHMYRDIPYTRAEREIAAAQKQGKKITIEDLAQSRQEYDHLYGTDPDVIMFHEGPIDVMERFADPKLLGNQGVALSTYWEETRKKKKVYGFMGHHHRFNVWPGKNAVQTDPDTIVKAEIKKQGVSKIIPYRWQSAEQERQAA